MGVFFVQLGSESRIQCRHRQPVPNTIIFAAPNHLARQLKTIMGTRFHAHFDFFRTARLTGDDVNHTSHRIRTKQHTIGPTEHFNALNIGNHHIGNLCPAIGIGRIGHVIAVNQHNNVLTRQAAHL